MTVTARYRIIAFFFQSVTPQMCSSTFKWIRLISFKYPLATCCSCVPLIIKPTPILIVGHKHTKTMYKLAECSSSVVFFHSFYVISISNVFRSMYFRGMFVAFIKLGQILWNFSVNREIDRNVFGCCSVISQCPIHIHKFIQIA